MNLERNLNPSLGVDLIGETALSTDKTSWEISFSPLVTVLIPCNDVEFLRDCLTSIEKQDYQNLKIVVVLNGPAAEMIDELSIEFASINRPLKFFTTRLAGIVNALNYGVEFCESEFIARIDADDLMPPTRIRLQVSEFQKDSELVCVGGQLEYLTSIDHRSHSGYPESYKEICHALHRFSSLPHPGVMLKKSALIEVGLYSQKFPHIEDWDLWARLSEVGKIVNLPVTTVLYRVHPNQITQTHSSEQRESVMAFSLSRLQACLKYPQKKNEVIDGISRKILIREIIPYLFFARKPTCISGAFARKEFRRRLAGYLYSKIGYINPKRFSDRLQIVFLCLAIVIVDPLILYVKTINQIRRIS